LDGRAVPARKTLRDQTKKEQRAVAAAKEKGQEISRLPAALLLAFCLFFSLTFSFPPFCFRSIIPVRREI